MKTYRELKEEFKNPDKIAREIFSPWRNSKFFIADVPRNAEKTIKKLKKDFNLSDKEINNLRDKANKIVKSTKLDISKDNKNFSKLGININSLPDNKRKFFNSLADKLSKEI